MDIEPVHHEDKPVGKRVLVAYATRAGSTAEVATAIGEVLARRGFSVDVKPIREEPKVDDYQVVILGSAIRMGNWLPEAMNFIRSNQAALDKIPTAIFTVHLLNTDDDKASRIARQAYTIPVRQILAPFDEVFFNGKLDYSKLTFFDRLFAKTVETNTDLLPSDYRDWSKISAWARTVLA